MHGYGMFFFMATGIAAIVAALIAFKLHPINK
jgi:hypothetical protein